MVVDYYYFYRCVGYAAFWLLAFAFSCVLLRVYGLDFGSGASNATHEAFAVVLGKFFSDTVERVEEFLSDPGTIAQWLASATSWRKVKVPDNDDDDEGDELLREGRT